MKERIGTVEISGVVVRDISCRDAMKAIMRHFVPIHIEYLGHKDMFEYTGYSDCFKETTQRQQPFKYYSRVKMDKYGNVLFDGFVFIEEQYIKVDVVS